MTNQVEVSEQSENPGGCPIWPRCGCGTQGGATTCQLRTHDNLWTEVVRLQQMVRRQATVIRAQAEEITRLRPLSVTDERET